jgi:hypothetical protein
MDLQASYGFCENKDDWFQRMFLANLVFSADIDTVNKIGM